MINAVIKCGDWGFPLTLMDLRYDINYYYFCQYSVGNYLFLFIRIVAKSYLDIKGVIVQVFGADNLPVDDWARSLLKRHQIIGQRLATNISRVRADVSMFLKTISRSEFSVVFRHFTILIIDRCMLLHNFFVFILALFSKLSKLTLLELVELLV